MSEGLQPSGDSPFVGLARPLTITGLTEAARLIAVDVPELWAVVAVETSGCGFLPDRRPQILFERHIFHDLTYGRFGVSDFSNPRPGGYGAGGANQYDRLAQPLALDRAAALQSASWGLGQVMGHHYAALGYPSVEAFVGAMCSGEDAQIDAIARFVTRSGLGAQLGARDWTAFARAYNGPAFAINHYDIRLQAEYLKAVAAMPDLTVRAAQIWLTYRGFHPGPIDGMPGRLTRDALQAFQAHAGLEPTGILRYDVLERLQSLDSAQ